MDKKPNHWTLFVCCIFLACQTEQPKQTAKLPAACNFYYWKTNLRFDKTDQAMADSLGVKKLYLRFFDVDWSPTRKMAIPVGELGEQWHGGHFDERNLILAQEIQIVPTVFLTNRVFSNDVPTDQLATDVSEKIRDITSGLKNRLLPWGLRDYERAEDVSNWDKRDSLELLIRSQFDQSITELQLDCDWTPSTKDRYFAFLQRMKEQNPGMTISCTVRLHQFRDQQSAGIPPVDQGTLMCYNVAPPKDPSVMDAIFDPALVNGYLKKGTYPLPLEAALPLFSWGALFHEDQFKGLVSGLRLSDIENNPLFEPMGDNRFRFTQDTVFSGKYLRRGDYVRVDGASPAELLELAARLATIDAVYGVSFFEWDLESLEAGQVREVFERYVSKK